MDKEEVIKHTKALVVRLGIDETESEKIKGMLEDAIVLVLDYTNREKNDRQAILLRSSTSNNHLESRRERGRDFTLRGWCLSKFYYRYS